MISLDDIREEINKEKDRLSLELFDDKDMEFCRNQFNSNRFMTMEQFTRIDIWNCLKCLCFVKLNGKKSLDDCSRIIDMLQDKIMNDKDNSSLDYKKVSRRLRFINLTGEVDELVDFINNYPNTSDSIISFYQTYRQANYDLVLLKRRLSEYPRLNSSMKNKIIENFYKDNYNISDLFEEYNKISSFVSKRENKNREVARKIRGYDNAFSILQRESSNDEIKKVKDIIKYIPNEDIKRMILIYISEHNKKYYDSLDKKLDSLKANSINLYYSIFIKYGLKVPLESIKDYFVVSTEDLEYIISTLKKKIDDEKILYVLKYSNKSIVERIMKYIEIGYMTLDFVNNNVVIFNSNCSLLSDFEKGIDIINGFGINPQLFIDDPSILINNNVLLKRNLLLLEEYDCMKYIRNASNYSFLLDDNLCSKLDKLLEFGFLEFLSQDIDCLNLDSNRFLRLDLLKKMNIPVDDIDSFMEVIDRERFIVEDSLIEDYLLDVSSYHCDDDFYTLDEIESNRVGTLTVSINGQIISYPKIMRRIKEGDSIKDAVCFGKYFTEEEYLSFIDRKTNAFQ